MPLTGEMQVNTYSSQNGYDQKKNNNRLFWDDVGKEGPIMDISVEVLRTTIWHNCTTLGHEHQGLINR